LLINFFINDIFYVIEYGTLYYYADDNTLSYVNDNYEKLIDILEKESEVLLLLQKCHAKGQKLKLDKMKV
jgi:hypothetical protein